MIRLKARLLAHLVIDYQVPDQYLVESKLRQLYLGLGAFRKHVRFTKNSTVSIGRRLVGLA